MNDSFYITSSVFSSTLLSSCRINLFGGKSKSFSVNINCGLCNFSSSLTSKTPVGTVPGFKRKL